MKDTIGGKIRTVRKSRGMTLNDLAQNSGLSVSYISNLERNLCSPTLENLEKLCSVLEIPTVRLLENRGWEDCVVRKARREVLFDRPGEARYESVRFGTGKLNALVVTIEPGCSFDKEWSHEYDELGYILEGSMTIRLNGHEYVLEPGDSIYIAAGDHHSIYNENNTPCLSYWVKRGD